MLGPGLVLAVLLVFCGAAEARTVYTIAGGGYLPPPRLGDPAVPATAVEFEDSVRASELGDGRLLLSSGRRTLMLDERGWLSAVRGPSPRPIGDRRSLGSDRFGTEYFWFFGGSPGFELRRGGGPYERFASLPSFNYGIVHPDGGVLVADNRRVVHYLPDGSVKRVAGTGRRGSSPDGVPATQARFRRLSHLVFAPDGALWITDHNDNRVRRIDPHDGRLSTVAGTGERGSAGDGGPATRARLDRPLSVVFGRHGGFAIVEAPPIGGHVRRVSRLGTIHTVAGSTHGRWGGRGLQLLTADGQNARDGTFNSVTQPLINGRDEYVIPDDELIRFVSSPRTRRLALALRTVVPERRRVSFTLSVPARLRLEVEGEGRKLVLTRSSDAGLGYFRLPAKLRRGGYRLKLTARTDDGAVAVREAPMLTYPRLPEWLAVSAQHANESDRPLITAGGIARLRYSLLGRETGCRRFGPRRVDCEFDDKVTTGECTLSAARLDRRGQIWVGSYDCSERGLERRPQGSDADWLSEPLWMLGPGPTYYW